MADPAIDEEEAESRFLLTGPVRGDAVAAVLDQLQPAALVVRDGWDRRLLDVAREQGVALLVEDDVDPDADGVHLTDPVRVPEVRAKLDQTSADRLILGVDIGLSRHDAMVAGEADADYVAFGERAQPVNESVMDLIAWWRGVTVVPCLGYADTIEAAASLARVGTDFIGIDDVVWNHPKGPIKAAEALRAAIEKT